MTDQRTSGGPRGIAPPPSLDDILGRSERIGTVDFSHRLAPEPEPEPEPAPSAPADPAPVGQDPVDEPPAGQPEQPVEHAEHAEHAVEQQTTAHVAAPAYDATTATDAPPDPEDTMLPPLVDDVASVAGSQVAALLSLVPAEDLATVGESFEDVVDTVLNRIRAAEVATVRHLAAVEEEAARRCEMITAQAELDAELIRLHARREAHAIIAASRLRAGEPVRPTSDEMALHQLGDAAGRLAEKLESLGIDPGTPDHPSLR